MYARQGKTKNVSTSTRINEIKFFSFFEKRYNKKQQYVWNLRVSLNFLSSEIAATRDRSASILHYIILFELIHKRKNL